LYQVEFPALAEWAFTEDMARHHPPVLSVYGADSDPFFQEGDTLIRQWLPQAETFVLPEASHGLEYMNPTGMAEGLVASSRNTQCAYPRPRECRQHDDRRS
jgi:pimeloyl-ACP methyl ester carboxylesterase